MVNFMRKYQQGLLAVVTVIVIITFVWLYDPLATTRSKVGQDQFGSIYNRPVYAHSIRRAEKELMATRELGQFQLFMGWQTFAKREHLQDETLGTAEFYWFREVIREESKNLGIEPTLKEVEDAWTAIPQFQEGGKFNKNLWATYLSERAGSNGMNQRQLEEILSDNLRLQKLEDLIGATVAPNAEEVVAAVQRNHEKKEVSVVRLQLRDFSESIQLTDEELLKIYEETKAAYMTDEERKVKFVSFNLEKNDKPLVGKERADAMQKLAERASEFALAVLGEEEAEDGSKPTRDAKALAAAFEEVAKQKNLTIGEVQFAQSQPPSELSQSPEAAQATFALTAEKPVSDLVISQNAYYVLLLNEVIAPKQETFEQRKSEVAGTAKRARGIEKMNVRARELRAALAAAVSEKKTFADAAAAQGLKADKLPPYSGVEPLRAQPNSNTIMRGCADLTDGQISDVLLEGDTRIIAHVDTVTKVEDAKIASEKAPTAERIAGSMKQALFAQWLKDRRNAAAIVSPFDKKG